ncbi:MAG: peptide chain release factor N(5)-glutamine methyltransferase, partial [Desulfitobacterium hafniense]|nr:peptide chain release factor N(5)-glutamine methyltransferase [Desulfitobacterium hafniense]
RYEADMLLSAVLGLKRHQLYLERERILTSNELKSFDHYLSRRECREPLQYILEQQEFMGLRFFVSKDVLIPRSDSEVLIEVLLAQGATKGDSIADLCTGSGALAISAAYFCPGTYVVGTDISNSALEVAKLNALKIGVKIEWHQGDFIDPIKNGSWDWIITNPPYVSEKEYKQCEPEIFFEPSIALLGGKDGLDFYRRLANDAPALLNPGGVILMEIGWQQAKAVRSLFESRGMETEVFTDLGGRDRVILAR